MKQLLVQYKKGVRTRSDLFTLLSEACELEHGLACSYLYAAFSLKQEVSEGITGAQLQRVRNWAGKVFFVAAQEMLHLSQVWNLLNAIGGTPYYFRPNFPQPSKYYPFNVALKLEPFSLEALQRFIMYELPSHLDEKAYAKATFGYVSEDDYNYQTVGELYRMIKEGFETIDEKALFIGNEALQMGENEIHFREIIKVTGRVSALRAIDLITEQGEGTKEGRENSHYETFRTIEQEFRASLTEDPNFQPARNTISNPITYLKGSYGGGEGEIILHPLTREVSDAFDDVYSLMVRALHSAFSLAEDAILRREVADFAIQLMIRVLKPLGELLAELPAFNDPLMKKAGASFALTRHIPLPPNAKLVRQFIGERGEDISQRLADLSGRLPKLKGIQLNYREIFQSVAT